MAITYLVYLFFGSSYLGITFFSGTKYKFRFYRVLHNEKGVTSESSAIKGTSLVQHGFIVTAFLQ
jgi:hypothetical protein